MHSLYFCKNRYFLQHESGEEISMWEHLKGFMEEWKSKVGLKALNDLFLKMIFASTQLSLLMGCKRKLF